jgi:hypothetical protein
VDVVAFAFPQLLSASTGSWPPWTSATRTTLLSRTRTARMTTCPQRPRKRCVCLQESHDHLLLPVTCLPSRILQSCFSCCFPLRFRAHLFASFLFASLFPLIPFARFFFSLDVDVRTRPRCFNGLTASTLACCCARAQGPGQAACSQSSCIQHGG